MKTKEELLNDLPCFTGTEGYFRYNPMLFPRVILTDGALFLAAEAEAYWLMDLIASHLPKVKDSFAVVMLQKHGDEATIVLADDNPATVVYARQDVEYTDFPLDSLTLYAINDGAHWVILLPSEY